MQIEARSERKRLSRRAMVFAAGIVAAALPLHGAVAEQPAGLPSQEATQEAKPPPQAAEPPAQIAVSPGKFEVRIDDKQSVQAVRLMNFSDRRVDVKVTVATWELDANSRVVLVEPTEQSLDQWMVFNPRSFSVEARSEQTVRFAIRPRVEPTAGEHRAMIYFEEQARTDVDVPVQVLFKVGVAVYGYAGEIERRGVLSEVQVAADNRVMSAAFDIDNPGNAHVRMKAQWGIWPVDHFPGVDAVAQIPDLGNDGVELPESMLMAGWLPNTPVLGGNRRQILHATAHRLTPGRYVFAALGELGPETFRRAVEFQVPAATPTRIAGEQQEAGGSDIR
jgi:P pilus assembly chaperone PapD